MSRLDLNLLRIFDAVMTERNVTRAATALCMTQPAVSNAINRLRAALNDPLFVKVQGGIAPTLRAEMLWPTVRDALAQLHQVLEPETFDPRNVQAGLRFAMSDFVAEELIWPLFQRLREVAPGVNVHLRPHGIENVSGLLERSEIDMAAGVFSNFAPYIRTLPIIRLKYVCAMRKDHPLLAERLSLDAFLRAQHLIVSLAGGTSLIDQELADQGYRRKAALTINQFSLVPRLLAESDLICVLPLSTIVSSPYHEHLAVVPPPCRIRDRSVSLVWHERSESEPLHRWARELILNICRQREVGLPERTDHDTLQTHSY